jgi:predicted glutamine amidotransferase
MCIILYKPSGKKLPNKQVLETCFKNNPDGAGFMFSHKGQVHIKKGFMDFSSFEENLTDTLKYIDEIKTPMVLHFRITTQGGVNQACTHPFPLSKNMSDLRQLQCTANIGVAHNGIISLTSEYGGGYYGYGSVQKKVIDYSDTMKFITDYLSLIIKSPKYYKDDDTLELIERLVDSKLAILDSYGHCELIGNFIKDDGIYYSNDSYKPRVYKYTTKTSKKKNKKAYDDYTIFDENDDVYGWGNYGYNDYDFYEDCYDCSTGEYDFSMYSICPIDDGLPDYCSFCSQKNNCSKRMNVTPKNYVLDDGITVLTPTKEYYRVDGVLFGISYDDNDNFYEVMYNETYDDFFPCGATLIVNEPQKKENGGE